MMRLYWLRHGTAEDKQLRQNDADRRLTSEGVQEVQLVAKYLRKLDLELDAVFCSPLVRAVETAETAAKVLGLEKKVRICDGLLPEDGWEALRQSLKEHLPFRNILLVGHQPSIGRMIGHLVYPHGNLQIPLKKAGTCRTDIEVLGQNPYGELVWLLNPKILRHSGAK